MNLGLEDGRCFPPVLANVNGALAGVDGVIAATAFVQLMRMHLRNPIIGWTRQKVFHLMIGFSNFGCLTYFVVTPFATCNKSMCWSHACGFILMACPKILLPAAFLLLLSFWVDQCHQTNDDDEEDEDSDLEEALLDNIKTATRSPILDNHRNCCPLLAIQAGSRQKIAVLVIFLVVLIMVAFSMLIWIGMGKNPIDSSVVARVYIDFFAILILILAGALAFYGSKLFFKISKVRYDKASTEMWKVAGLAVVSVVCFTASGLIALTTDIPLMYQWHPKIVDGLSTPLLIVIYYFIGSSVPSAFALWAMSEMPPSVAVTNQLQSRTVAYFADTLTETSRIQYWTTATTSQNQTTGWNHTG
ncbi:hypothetical protein Sjap_000750 [Stephania japonica]|uniref:THH1/TOM1/TOM3 domain-containing protein n=1 Tax=Stephania japonica TaxID=461633 RepID=A0AAP0KLA0_9MAGN